MCEQGIAHSRDKHHKVMGGCWHNLSLGGRGVCDFCKVYGREEGMKDRVDVTFNHIGVMTPGKVTLTRAQVEAAWKELNEPDPPIFRSGDIVKFKRGTHNNTYVVVDAYIAQSLYPTRGRNDIVVISLLRGCSYLVAVENLEKVEK